jgi:hypothetical protein
MHDVQSGMVSATARLGALLCIAVSVSACAARSPARQRLACTPAEFRREVARRAPDLDPESVRVPFELSGEIVERARQVVIDQKGASERIMEQIRPFFSPPTSVDGSA